MMVINKLLRQRRIPSTDLYKLNRNWVTKLKDAGYSVLDMGNPHNKGKSVWYEMEKEILFND